MTRKNILILGGLGFIGKNLIEELMSDYNLIVFDHKSPHTNKSYTYYSGNFQDQAALEVPFKHHKIDLIIHAISTTIPASDQYLLDIESNLVSTINLLNLMRKYAVTKIVFLSSGGTVYGISDKNLPRSEMNNTDPISSYGAIKLTIEKYLYLYQRLHNINYLILRLSNPFGPYHTSMKHGLINVTLKKVINHEPITVWGTGDVIRDYIYIKDCTNIIHKLIDNNIINQIINIGSGQGHSINTILDYVKQCVGDFKIQYEPSRSFDVPNIVLDISKLKSIIDFNPTPLKHGIKLTYNWLKTSL